MFLEYWVLFKYLLLQKPSALFSVESLLGFSLGWALTPCELEQEAPLRFTPHPLPATAQQTKAFKWTGPTVSMWPDPALSGGVSTWSRPHHKGQMLSASTFKIGNNCHPQLMSILSLDDKLRRQTVCQVVINSSPTECCLWMWGMWICSVVQQSGRQRDGPGPSATVGHTKHLVTDPSGCMTTLHWAACVWDSWIDTWSVFTADLVHTSGIPAQSCPH